MKLIFTPGSLMCPSCRQWVYQEFNESLGEIGLKHADAAGCENNGKVFRMPKIEVEEVQE